MLLVEFIDQLLLEGTFLESDDGPSNVKGVHVFDSAKVTNGSEVHENGVARDKAIVDGRSLVYGNGVVSGNASIKKDSEVSGNAVASENAVLVNTTVTGKALVYGKAYLEDSYVDHSAKVFGNARILNGCTVKNNSRVSDSAVVVDSEIKNRAKVFGESKVEGSTIGGGAQVSGKSRVEGSDVSGKAQVSGDAKVLNGSTVDDNAIIMGKALVDGATVKQDAEVTGNAVVRDQAVVAGSGKVTGGLVEGFNTLVLGLVEGKSRLYDGGKVGPGARLSGNAQINGIIVDNVHVTGNAKISSHYTRVTGNVVIKDDAEIFGESNISGNAKIGGKAKVWHADIGGKANIGGTAVILKGTWDGSEGKIMSGAWEAPGVPYDKKTSKLNVPSSLSFQGNERREYSVLSPALRESSSLIESSPRYEGPALEKGGTSIAGKAAPAVRDMLGNQVKEGMRVLDYGAGKYARNADFLREAGVEVYAYDPFGGVSGVDGWEMGKISKKLPPPSTHFDLAFSAYVLNVVPEHIEDDIIADMKRFSSKQIHITRNVDIADSVKKALLRGESTVTTFYLNYFAPRYPGTAEELEETGGAISKETLMDFCGFGVETSRGFQRIPELEDKGFRRTKMKTGYKVYEK